MAKKKKNKLPKVETMIIWVAVISFVLWAMSKCSKDDFKDIREKALDLPSIESDEATGDTSLHSAETSTTLTPDTNMGPPNPTSNKTNTPNKTDAEPTLSRLYVTIDNLNMRSEPSLSGSTVEQLPLYATVYFMNEVTDSTQEINLGRSVANEPWVKVKSTSGKVGWVYGAGVHYYKMKNKDAY